MNCWEILGIDPTDDTTSIRRNYARLVKENRPDENPEAFAAINRAYKDALVHAQHLATQSDKQAETPPAAASENPSGHVHHEIDGAAEHETHVDDAAQKELISGIPLDVEQIPLEDLNAAWQRLTEKTLQLLESPDEAKEVSNWQFLEESDALYDIHFKSHFSRFLFQELISASPEEAFNHPLKGAVIDYLDSRFGWRLHRDDLEYDFDFADIDLILGRRPSLAALAQSNEKRNSPLAYLSPKQRTSTWPRLLAAVVDFGIALYLIELMPFITEVVQYTVSIILPDHQAYLNPKTSIHEMVAAICVLILITTIFEASPIRATPGKLLFDMNVVDISGNKLTIGKSFNRSLLWLIASGAIPFVLLLYTGGGERGILGQMMQTMAPALPIANLAWPYPGFGHDALSKTLVLKR